MTSGDGQNTLRRNIRRRRHKKVLVSSRHISLLMTALGVLLLLLASSPFWNFPRVGFWLLPVGLAYLVALWFQPRLWLIALPLFTVGVDLTTYSGRFIYNELDWIFLITVASGLLYGRVSLDVFKPRIALFLVLAYLALLLIGMRDWSVFISPPQAAYANPYYLADYGYKLIKGVLWAFLLVPMWIYLLRDSDKKATDWLIFGCCSAALLLGLIILWERGTLALILSASAWYHIVNSALDLSWSYRVTGFFSDMHTGGEVLDGVIILLLPATLHGVFAWRTTSLRVFAGFSLLSLAWCTLVGFTRTTYVCFGLGAVLYAVFYFAQHYRWQLQAVRMSPAWFGAAMLAAFVAGYCGFAYAGSYGLLGFAGIQLLAYLSQCHFAVDRRIILAGTIMCTSLLVTLAIDAHLNSRWVESSSLLATVIGLSFLISFVLSRVAFQRSQFPHEFDYVVAVSVLVLIPIMVAFALGGTKMNERFSAVSKDWETRTNHWSRVVKSAGRSVPVSVLGNGAGAFPRNYVYQFPETVAKVGSFSVQNSEANYLELGGGNDLAFGQRVEIESHTDYELSIWLRSTAAGRISIFLCERNLIFASNFAATCEGHTEKFEATDPGFTELRFPMNSGKVGEGGALERWPTLLYLKNLKKGSVVEVDSVQLYRAGSPMLLNAGFSQGMDNWFFYNDFSHLPWHIKNTWVQLWYDSGWLGLVLFVLITFAGLRVGISRGNYSGMQAPMLIAVLSLLVLGIFGTPLDSSRVSWLFYFYLFTLALDSGPAAKNT